MAKVSELVRSTLSNANIYLDRPGNVLREKLVKQGITVLGWGMYGAAIEDSGEVFKIFGSQERGYGAFIRFMKGKSSVLLPRVKVVGSFGSFTCAHIERLHTMANEIGGDLACEVASWISYVAHKEYAKLTGGHCYWNRHRFPEAASQFVNKTNMVGLVKKMVAWSVENEGSLDRELTFDLHHGNMMVRRNDDGTKQIVITDPFC